MFYNDNYDDCQKSKQENSEHGIGFPRWFKVSLFSFEIVGDI